MSQENLQVVEDVISAVNDRDVDRYLAHCTNNIRLETPWTAVEGVYEGPDAIRRFFSDLRDTAPDFQLVIERLERLGADRVLGLLWVSASGRASGITAERLHATGRDTPTANIYDFAGAKIRRIRIFLDRQEALEAAGLRGSAMSQENVELARQAFDAFNRRDLGAYLALMDADVEVGSLLVALEGDYRGHAGIRRWWSNLHEVVPDYTGEVVEARDLGDLTLVTLRTRGHGADSDTPFETPLWWIGQWRRGKCVWWRSCGTEAEALEAAGLRE